MTGLEQRHRLKHATPVPGCPFCRHLRGLNPAAPIGQRPSEVPAPCVHEGNVLEQCHTCSGHASELRHVRECDLHDRCTRGPNRAGLASCVTCPDYKSDETAAPAVPLNTHARLTPSTPVARVEDLFRRTPGPWPPGWDGWENVRQAFRNLFDRAAKGSPPPPPEWQAERGVVICGGGWGFFPSIYVTVRVLRHVGCKLPVQVWYLGDRGEFDPRMEAALRPYGVGWVDANALWRDQPGVAVRRANVDHGWMLKPFAAAFAPFREVVCLDADSYPAADPERLLDHPEFRRVGACFWPDINPLQKGQFERLGVAPPERPVGFESGQFLVDKGRHWHPLWLTAWLNAHHEYVWGPGHRHLYGDKDTFYLAWLKLGREFCLPTARPGWSHPAFLQRDFDGKTAFVHRTRDKFRFFHPVDGQRVANRYNTAQAARDRQHYNRALPHEDLAHALARECDQLISPGRTFRFRPGTHDEAIWGQVTLDDEYRLPELHGGTVLDAGGHVGAFAWAALRRGAGAVHSYEPHPESYSLLRENAAKLGDRVTVFGEALWSHPAELTLAEAENPANTGGRSALRPPGGGAPRVRAVGFDEAFARAEAVAGKVRLVKLDVEGAEWPILSASAAIARAGAVVGEYHSCTWGGKGWGPDDLVRLLAARGFRVRVEARDGAHGLFWADRGA